MRLLLRGQDVPGSAQWDSKTSALTFLPVRRLGLGATYTARITGPDGIDIASWTFRTRDGRWRASEVLDRAKMLSLALNSTGQGVLAFGSDTADQLKVFAVRFDLDNGFSKTVEMIRATAPTNLHDLHTGFAASGAALAGWVEYTGSYAVLQSRSQKDGSWETADLLESSAGHQTLHHASLRPDGSGLVIWQDGAPSRRLLALSLTPSGRGDPVSLNFPSVGEAAAATIAEGGAWLVEANSGKGLFARRMTASGTWDSPTELHSSEARTIGVTVTSDGTALASFTETFSEGTLSRRDGFVRRFTGAGWDETVRLDTRGSHGSSEALGLTTALDPLGDALAIWMTRNTYVVSQTATSTTYESSYEVRAQRFETGTGWATSHVELEPESTMGYSAPALTIDPQGNGLSVWSNGSSMRAARFSTDAGWQSSQVIDDSTGGAVNLAADDRGRAMAVWMSGNEIRAARFLEPEP
jgi:hypothetical protein